MTDFPVVTALTFDKKEKMLHVSFQNGTKFSLSAEYLRVESPSAEVQGHAPEERIFPAGCKDVSVLAMEPVGNYAVRLVFDDLHESGIYSWDYLYLIGQQYPKRWQTYLAALEKQGLSREKAPSTTAVN